jgi:hypothetical protein
VGHFIAKALAGLNSSLPFSPKLLGVLDRLKDTLL